MAASSEAKVEDGVARAVRLAANLSNQLFVDLPPEPRNSSSNNEATTASASNERKSRKKSQDRGGGGGRQRKHKSLSPEKRLASTLAQSMSSISKSFEKLDLIGGLHHRKRSRSHQNESQKKQRKRSEANAASAAAAASNKEVTIAKLGRFKFSVEVAKQFENERKKSEKPYQNSSSNR